MRKPWMNDLQSYRFNREGTMLQETAKEHAKAERRKPLKGAADYAAALGISVKEAHSRIHSHRVSAGAAVAGQISATVSDRLSQLGGCDDPQRKKEQAKALGLRDISGGAGSFSAVVGVPKDAPNVVVKVVPQHDRFVIFADAILKGHIQSKHFPAIYSITKVGESYVVVMERVSGKLGEHGREQVYCIDTGAWGAPQSIQHALDEINKLVSMFGVKTDYHTGNFLLRTDGTIVFIDPVWGSRHDTRDCLEGTAEAWEQEQAVQAWETSGVSAA